MHIQIVTFHLTELTHAAFLTLCDQLAPQLAGTPGLLSKVWLSNEATNTYGGVYTWESRAAMERYTTSDVFAAVAAHPNFEAVTSTDFSVLEGPTVLTHGMSGLMSVAV
jgi:quinol monooxygenase YgiN